MTRHPPRGAAGEPWFLARNPHAFWELRTSGRRWFPVSNPRFPGRDSLNSYLLLAHLILSPIVTRQWHAGTTGRRPTQGSRGARRRPGAPQTAPRTRASAWTPAPRRATWQLSAARGIDLDWLRRSRVVL
jgi:hypothetical protein